MRLFVDTSALYALLDADDESHAAARASFERVLDEARLVTHSYVVVETTALVQRRLGMDAVRVLTDDLLPVLDVAWVDANLHGAATAALLAAGRRELSLVDWVSFTLMRREAIRQALAFDDDFTEQGFELVA